MVRLDGRARDGLPDRAFAYIDSKGRRLLPIHDETHVRNALARFNQVSFQNDEAKDRARTRLLQAAKRFRIVPVGFIASQFRHVRGAIGEGRRELPAGFVTMVMTDIESSTDHLLRLGDGYGALLEEVRSILRTEAEASEGVVVESRADEFFAAYENPAAALQSAVAVQRRLAGTFDGDRPAVRVRVGIHSGYPTLSADNYIGMAVHIAARVCSSAHGGQIIATGDTRLAAARLEGVRFRSLGRYRLRGIPSPVALYQVDSKGLRTKFPVVRAAVSEA